MIKLYVKAKEHTCLIYRYWKVNMMFYILSKLVIHHIYFKSKKELYRFKIYPLFNHLTTKFTQTF